MIENFQTNLIKICNDVYGHIGGYGPEKFYQNALLYELRAIYSKEYDIYSEEVISMEYKGIVCSTKRVDITIYKKDQDQEQDQKLSDNPVIVLELKWNHNTIIDIPDPYQLSYYLKILNCEYGFLINFEKLGSFPTDFCAKVYDLNTKQDQNQDQKQDQNQDLILSDISKELNNPIIFRGPEPKKGSVSIFRFENKN